MKKLALALAALLFTQSLAFQWEPFDFPSGDQRYVIEVRHVERGEEEVNLITIDIRDVGGSYTVNTTMSFSQEDVSHGDLGDAVFGGSSVGLLALGPMMLFGPAFMMLPMVMMGEEIRVRSEPLIIMGLGRLYMDQTVETAGRECVLLRFETAQGDDPIEFALAENLPFPCLARFGNGSSFTEVRLVEASF